MKKILVLQHAVGEGPGLLVDALARRGFTLTVKQMGSSIAEPLVGVDRLLVLGGPQSANDEWAQEELTLIKSAHMQRIPIMGVCLGAQLLSRALGASVHHNSAKEVGWYKVWQVCPSPAQANAKAKLEQESNNNNNNENAAASSTSSSSPNNNNATNQSSGEKREDGSESGVNNAANSRVTNASGAHIGSNLDNQADLSPPIPTSYPPPHPPPTDKYISNVKSLLGDIPGEFETMHWHDDTFHLPEGAVLIFSSHLTKNQGYVMGPHLAIQFHPELDGTMISDWIAKDSFLEHPEADAMTQHLEKRTMNQREMCDHLVGLWMGLEKGMEQ